MKTNVNISERTANILIGLTDNAGTFEFFDNTLMRIFHSVLLNTDDFGMDDTEAIETLRAIQLLRHDLKTIAADKSLGESLKLAIDRLKNDQDDQDDQDAEDIDEDNDEEI